MKHSIAFEGISKCTAQSKEKPTDLSRASTKRQPAAKSHLKGRNLEQSPTLEGWRICYHRLGGKRNATKRKGER